MKHAPLSIPRGRCGSLPGLLALVSLCGCIQDLDTVYGRRSGPVGGPSVNGTAVLADMFEDAGYQVDTRRWLSPNLQTAQVIVWAPDNFKPPSEEVRKWLDEWLFAVSGRTLIYIGRDFDAAPQYWKKAEPLAPVEQQPEFNRRSREAKVAFKTEREKLPEEFDSDWFSLSGKLDQRDVRTLSGPWAEGIAAADVEIELNGRMGAPRDGEILLGSDRDMLVARQRFEDWTDSQLILVANGSFLLNLPLVNHAHRKLAGRLIAACGEPGRVVFLQSGNEDPKIYEKDPSPHLPNSLDLLGVWPLGVVLLHLAALGIIFCFARLSIFGTPREPPGEPASDFGQHVAALGRLLSRTKNRSYAEAEIRRYRELKSDDVK